MDAMLMLSKLLTLLLPFVVAAVGRRIKVHEIEPNLAHRDAAGTALLVNGTGFADFGDTRCRFGGELWTRATVMGRHMLRCHVPIWPAERMWHGVMAVPLEVSLNGVDYSVSGTLFTFYDLQSVFISAVMPNGGPTLGDTRVTIHGSGFIRASRGPATALPSVSAAHRESARALVPCRRTSLIAAAA
jgi:hypothetical protein